MDSLSTRLTERLGLSTPVVQGDVEEVPLYAGQSAGLVADRLPAAAVV